MAQPLLFQNLIDSRRLPMGTHILYRLSAQISPLF
jgi:hypothetical protein